MSDLYAALLWLSVTLVTFVAMDRLAQRLGRPPWLHPVLLASPVIMAVLVVTDTPYSHYTASTALISFLLGPAVVSMAVPIWAQRDTIRQLAVPIALALMAGCVTAMVSAVGIVWMFGAPKAILATMAPRAVTTPVGMAMTEPLGGIPALTAVIIIFSGVLGAMIATPMLNLMRIEDRRARGFAVGVSAHGAGAARAFEVHPLTGAYAGLGMALNAVATAILLSIVALFI